MKPIRLPNGWTSAVTALKTGSTSAATGSKTGSTIAAIVLMIVSIIVAIASTIGWTTRATELTRAWIAVQIAPQMQAAIDSRIALITRAIESIGAWTIGVTGSTADSITRVTELTDASTTGVTASIGDLTIVAIGWIVALTNVPGEWTGAAHSKRQTRRK